MGRAGCREATCRQHNKTTRTCASTRHNAEDKAKIEETSVEKARNDDPRSHAKLEKSTPKTTENRLWSDLGRFEAIRVAQGSANYALKTAQERPEGARGDPRALSAAPERPKAHPKLSKYDCTTGANLAALGADVFV